MSVGMPPACRRTEGTILIVDDTPSNLGVIAECLEAQGFRVMTAQDGEEGIQRADFAQPDLILLDVMMDGINGFEVCRRLKALAGTRHIPVIFMTALSQSEDKVAGFAAGGVDYITKPLQIDEVVARVNTHLRIVGLQKQLEAQNAQLQKYREKLELQVAERTAELSESRRRLREEIAEREQEFFGLVENSPDTIARYDKECRRIYANPTLMAGMGGDPAKILGLTPAQIPGGVTGLEYEEKIREVFAQREQRDVELRWPSPAGEICTHIRISPEFDLEGNVVRVLAVGRDITEIDQYRKKIHQQAFFDNLTGLPNRLLLSERMQQAMAADLAHDRCRFSLIALDLDNFKEVNDVFGHSTGDLLLRETAKRLQALARACDTVARLSEDGFALLLPESDGEGDPNMAAGRILHALAAPVMFDGREFVVTASIGIARYPEDSSEIVGLYSCADSAMHYAKKMGRNTFQFYAREMTLQAAQRLEMEAGLRKAQKNGELELYYQPQVDMQTGRLIGAEALLRWNRPGHGMVTPDRFVAVAESTGLIVEIGEWVLTAACRAAAGWNRDRTEPLRIAVNLSSRQFIRNDLSASVSRILNETGCKPEWLKLEITESLLLEDSLAVTATLQTLGRMGVSIAIDDFGTGYSALGYLVRFPVSQLKIDRSFVSGLPASHEKSELVKAMLSISAALRLETVAEGVENSAQAGFLIAHGARLAQGYLFGKPMPPDEFDRMVRQRNEARHRDMNPAPAIYR